MPEVMKHWEEQDTDSGASISSPISLEDIAAMNRKRHAQFGGKMPNHEGGPLELEAIAAVHELAAHVQAICVSDMLPRTAELIFVNVKTLDGHPYTLELTMKGWRIASVHTDCMNGDYTNFEMHTKYYDNAKQVLAIISPNHVCHFNHCLTERLNQLKTDIDQHDEENARPVCPSESQIVRMVISPPYSDHEGDGELIFDMNDD
ncbi:hypothetical protein QR680_002978 [Steinernema hermaphroditum]|uniref:GSKIP domain-containing protein n=1 Tax=Steinernema hermaphroditum TaxID=289476 RepID=A0AA39H4W0_9BILA|nr:hypothetical protein QR680_002978 [Steinernema hermaphroditum]